MRFAMRPPINIPPTAPAANGIAIGHCMCPDTAALATPVIAINDKTPNDVATIDRMGRSVSFFSAGTIMKPPPTPSKPDKRPATAPAVINDLAHGTDQIRRPML